MSKGEITLETVKLVHKYILDRDHDNLLQILDTVSKLCKGSFGFLRPVRTESHFNAVMSIVFELMLTDPCFLDSDEMINVIEKLLKNYQKFNGCGYNTVLFYFTMRYSEMLLNNNENALNALPVIARLFDGYDLERILSDMLEISTDEKFLEVITDILEDDRLLLGNYIFLSKCFYDWLWLYMTAIICQNRFDLLDRAVEIIYKTDWQNFLSKAYHSKNEIGFLKYVNLLFERYAPEISRNQIRELVINSDYIQEMITAHIQVSNINIQPGKKAGDILKSLVSELSELDVKIKNINSLLDSGIELNDNIDDGVINKLFGDETIFYIGARSWYIEQNYKWLLQYVKNHPKCIISIDNFKRSDNTECYLGLSLNNTQFKALIKGRKIVMTDKVSENKCLNELIKGGAKILPLVISALDADEQMCIDLIDLCTKYNNIKALNAVNDIYINIRKEV